MSGIDGAREYCIFKTLVNGRLAEVWCRAEKHENGKWNGTPEDWWLNIGTAEKPEWIPWVDKCVNRVCWSVSLKTGNYTKSKWDEISVNPSGGAEIFCNGRKVYEFGGWDIDYLFSKANYLIKQMSEHPFNFANPDDEVGRKIWYYGQPATILENWLEQGCIYFQKDGEGGFDMRKPWDREEDGDLSEWHGQDKIKDDVLSPHICWFREDQPWPLP